MTERSAAKAVLNYNLARLGLLAACLVIGWFAGLRNFALIVVAFLVSGVLSWFLLSRQRIGMGQAMERVITRGRAKLNERTAAEDAYVDELERSK